MIRFQCPACQKILKTPEHGAGRKINCPKCGQKLLVPPPIQRQNKTVLGQSIPNPCDVPSSSSESTQQQRVQISFECPSCRTTFFVPEQMIGRMIDCPKCQTTFAALSDSARSGSFASSETEPGRPSNRSSGLEFNRVTEDIEVGATPRQHSGLGIASFLIALLVGGMEGILALIIVRNMVAARSAEAVEIHLIAGSMSLVCWNFFSLPACLVGAGMALVALIAHKDRHHLFTWLGLLGNGVVILIVLGLIFLSMVKNDESDRRRHFHSMSIPSSAALY